MNDIPPEILEAATKIDLYFKKQNIDTWELGNVCSRNHANKLRESISERLQNENDKTIYNSVITLSLAQCASSDHSGHE